jgi:xylulokinase
MEYVVGFDFGTGSLKTTLLTLDGNIAAEQVNEYENHIFNGNWAEQDPDIWYETIPTALANIASEFGIDPKKIIAVSITGQMRSIILLGKDGKALRPSILWSDCRCEEQVRKIAETHNDVIRRITHSQMNSTCTLPKILWLMENEEESWSDAVSFLFPSDYVNYKLTGNLAMDRNMASGTCIYDVNIGEWSEEIMSLYYLDKNKFPPIVDIFSYCGKITAAAAATTGLAQGAVVITGAGDSAVETFATGIRSSVQVKVRLGSSADISSAYTLKELQAKKNFSAWTYMFPGTFVGGVPIKSCGQSVKWVRKMFFRELPKSAQAYEWMEEEASDVPAGADGVLYHPYLLGEMSPYNNTDIRAMFHGLSLEHERKHIVRALFEGLSFAVRDSMQSENILDSCDTVIAIGGGAKSKLWMPIFSDILCKKIRIPKYSDASYGAALIAGDGAGVWKAIDLIDEKSINYRIIEPKEENVFFYNKLFVKYKQLALEEIEKNPKGKMTW